MYSDKDLVEKLKLLTWDTNLKAEDLLEIIKSDDEKKLTAKNGIYIKILNWFSWHQVREMFPEEKLPQLLTDSVIQGLFPRDLREKYRYVRSLL